MNYKLKKKNVFLKIVVGLYLILYFINITITLLNNEASFSVYLYSYMKFLLAAGIPFCYFGANSSSNVLDNIYFGSVIINILLIIFNFNFGFENVLSFLIEVCYFLVVFISIYIRNKNINFSILSIITLFLFLVNFIITIFRYINNINYYDNFILLIATYVFYFLYKVSAIFYFNRKYNLKNNL